MKPAIPLIILAGTLFLSACDTVTVQQPMGEEIVALDEATWQGSWLGEEVVMLTTVIDGEKGLLQAAWLERGPEGARFESVTGTVRHTGPVVYLNTERDRTEDRGQGENTDESPSPPEFLWARIENNGQRALLWWPDVEHIRTAVGENRLPGTIRDDDDILLGPLNPAQQQQIDSPSGNLLKWTEPLVLVRMAD